MTAHASPNVRPTQTAAAQTVPGTVPLHRGMTFGFYARNGYLSSPQARRDVQRMAELNIGWVCLVATVMQETVGSRRQFRDFEFTPADDELRDMIDMIHDHGMKVQLRPMLECHDGATRTHINFPHEPEVFPNKPLTHWDDWFASMTLRTLHYARLAQRAGADAYGLDSELDQSVRQQDHWKRVIAAARSVYDGHLTTSHTTRVDVLSELEGNSDHWFYDLDSLGISFYHKLAEHPGATVEQMLPLAAVYRDSHRKIAELYGKPFYFGECGCCSVTGAAKQPGYWSHGGGYDGQEQANYLEAVLKTYWDEPWWMGLYWWRWDDQYPRPEQQDDPAGDKGFIVDGKPAAQVIKRWFGKEDRRWMIDSRVYSG